MVVCNFYAEALFCTLLRPFVPFCALLQTCVLCVFLRPTAFRTTAFGNCGELFTCVRVLDIFETPVTVNPPIGNFKNFKFFKNSLKILNVYFWGTSVYCDSRRA